MSAHLYAGLAGRIRWFARRFGWSEIVFKPFRLIFAPFILPLLKPGPFVWRDEKLTCFFARYNMTWAGERMVEIPIGKRLLEQYEGRRVLEVGHVLGHYFPPAHTILDKFEVAPGVLNLDIIDYRPAEKFDLILSISTFEHIGFDDESEGGSGPKILACVQHCRSLLAPEGRLILTFPTGYNPELDEMLRTGALGAARIDCLKRTGRREWAPCTMDEAFHYPYRSQFPYGNALVVAEFSAIDRIT
jgi:SAM-dependent methyltransferase